MLPLGILNASTRNVRITRKTTTAIWMIFVHSQKKPRDARRLFTCCSAALRCSGVISGEGGTGSRSGSEMLILL